MASQYINSPGVQINEIDLSLRSSFNPGCTVVLPGFAAQGPVSEPIFVSTVSELETIFGIPTNAAERYFYYSCRELLNSPANIVAVRLPYGLSAGSGFSNTYTALLYPMVLSAFENTALNGSSSTTLSSWAIGKPTHVDLSEENYLNLLQGNYTWLPSPFSFTIPSTASPNPSVISITLSSNKWGGGAFASRQYTYNNVSSDLRLSSIPSVLQNTTQLLNYVQPADTAGLIPVGDLLQLSSDEFQLTENGAVSSFKILETSFIADETYVAAGFFVLNSLQTTINESGEGYYVGFADNSAFFANSPDYLSIGKLQTVKSTSGTPTRTYNTLPSSKLDFKLSATFAEGNFGATCISEQLEKVGFVGFESEAYQDHLSFGVFKIRKSTADAARLSIGPVEKYLGSFDYNRKRTSPTGGVLQNAYLEEVVNNGSNAIKLFINPHISREFDWTTDSSQEPNSRLIVKNEARALFPVGSYSPDTLAQEQSKLIGQVPLKLDRAMLLIENPETLLIDVIVDAGLSTVYSFSEAGEGYFDEELYLSEVDENQYENWKSVTDKFVKFASENRKDCMALIDPPRNVFVTGKNLKVIETPGKNFKQHIYDPLRNCFDKYESNYTAAYANWIKDNDMFTGKKMWLPFSGYAAAIFARSDAATFPWFAPAGLNRGNFNTIDLAFNPNQKQRDRLYEIPVNPVAFFSGEGFTVMGQKTLQNKPSAFDRINVRRLFLTLERAVQKTVKYYVFEPNTEFTRSSLVNTIAPLFEYAKNNQGLYDYLIVCDSRNNTPDIIDNNQLIVDIYLKPVRAAEFILVNFIATRTGQDFTELI
jgi:hypothetical protein